MIVVTGTKRSGTSAWMQILAAAGFPVVGDPFPGRWSDSIREANPRGFYESGLRRGIWWATNPDPKTGKYLHPKASRRHVIKIFVPGLVRTDAAFLDAVVATMRPWRTYGASLRRLYALEDAWLDAEVKVPGSALTPERVAVLRRRRGQIPLPVEWWFENYDLLRNLTTRRIPFQMLTFDRLLRDPEKEIGVVLGALGGRDLQAACGVVDRALRRSDDSNESEGAPLREHAEIFDSLYDHIDAHKPISAGLLAAMNQTQDALVQLYDLEARRSDEEDLERDG